MRRRNKIQAMSGDPLAIVIAILIGTTVQVVVAVTGYWKLSQMLRQITAEVTYNVLQGRRIEDVLRDMRESLRGMGESPAK